MRRIAVTPVRVAGAALIVVASAMAISAIVALLDGGGGAEGLFWSAVITVSVGTGLFFGSNVSPSADSALAFASVAWSWIAVSLAGALPFLLTGVIPWVRLDDALFESVSGFTCSGSTILSDFGLVPQGLLFFRSMTQWLGGMGLVVLAVAVLPALGIGGLELIASEAPGPTADRLSLRVRDTARRLWLLYGAVTCVVALVLFSVGMSVFDAVTHAFTTVSTGGYSPHAESIAHFDSFPIELVLIVGMLYSGANFSLHWHALTQGIGAYRRVSEIRWYFSLIAGAFAMLLWINHGELEWLQNLRESLFYAVSLGSNTGFGNSNYILWMPAAHVTLLVLMLVGGMSGSTAGGMKVLRLQVIFRYSFRELLRARHPNAIIPIRMGSTTIEEQVAAKVVGFVLLYLGLIVAGGIALSGLGVDPVTAFSGSVSAIGNVGPALGEAGPTSNYLVFPRAGRVVLMALMALGRLEVFPAMLMLVASTRGITQLRRRQRLTHSTSSH
ncbi:MAG: TrkH family potassium uptake protein [Actinomycetota bacterium]|nr:TrkH family potassium uptake protein [Actinomycetota bacterium]